MNDDVAFSRNFLIGQFRGGVWPKSHPITRVNHFGGLFEISLPLFSFFFFLSSTREIFLRVGVEIRFTIRLDGVWNTVRAIDAGSYVKIERRKNGLARLSRGLFVCLFEPRPDDFLLDITIGISYERELVVDLLSWVSSHLSIINILHHESIVQSGFDRQFQPVIIFRRIIFLRVKGREFSR